MQSAHGGKIAKNEKRIIINNHNIINQIITK